MSDFKVGRIEDLKNRDPFDVIHDKIKQPVPLDIASEVLREIRRSEARRGTRIERIQDRHARRMKRLGK